MKDGNVYIASNISFPHLLKIGCTSKDVHRRIYELSSCTSIPTEFKLEFDCHCLNYIHAEKIVHQFLEKFRFKKNKEFFEITIEEAIQKTREAIKDLIISENNYKDKPFTKDTANCEIRKQKRKIMILKIIEEFNAERKKQLRKIEIERIKEFEKRRVELEKTNNVVQL